jgi:hypothetical protein
MPNNWHFIHAVFHLGRCQPATLRCASARFVSASDTVRRQASPSGLPVSISKVRGERPLPDIGWFTPQKDSIRMLRLVFCWARSSFGASDK